MICASPIQTGKNRGQPATGTTADYNRHRRALETSCDPCLKAASANAKAWQRANPEGQKASSAKWRQANPAIIRAKHLRTYHLTPDDVAVILANQDGKCAICGTTEPGPRGFDIDHDHSCCPPKESCGKCVRGLLCRRCNFRLAIFEDAEYARAARSYLRSYE